MFGSLILGLLDPSTTQPDFSDLEVIDTKEDSQQEAETLYIMLLFLMLLLLGGFFILKK